MSTVVPLSDKIVTLGVTIDSNLALSNHSSNICRSTHYHIRALHHIRRSLTDDVAKTVAASIDHSRIDYANSLVHGSKNIKKLQRLQNTDARIVLPHLSQLPTISLLRELHWLTVYSRITYKLSCLTYNALNAGHLGYLRSLINYCRPIPSRTLWSTNQLLDCPPFSTEFGKRSFSYLALTVWNVLPLDIRLSPTTDTFKRRLKTHLFA